MRKMSDDYEDELGRRSSRRTPLIILGVRKVEIGLSLGRSQRNVVSWLDVVHLALFHLPLGTNDPMSTAN